MANAIVWKVGYSTLPSSKHSCSLTFTRQGIRIILSEIKIKKCWNSNNQIVQEMLHSSNLSQNRSLDRVETFNSSAWNLFYNESRKQHCNVIDLSFPSEWSSSIAISPWPLLVSKSPLLRATARWPHNYHEIMAKQFSYQKHGTWSPSMLKAITFSQHKKAAISL